MHDFWQWQWWFVLCPILLQYLHDRIATTHDQISRLWSVSVADLRSMWHEQVQLIAPKLDDAARACILQDLTPFVSAQAYDLAVQRAAVDVGFAFKNASTLSSAASS